MFSSLNRLLLIIACGLGSFTAPALAQSSLNFQGIGRAATNKEIEAWDIDVRPDFKGLPPGSGSVSKGQDVWENKCSQCHGIFGDSNEVFTPLISSVSPQDIKTGRVSKLRDPNTGRTIFMTLATLSTLWDFIHRAMPWNQPKSLTNDEVYAVTAYMLNLSGIVEDNFVLSDQNMTEVQNKMPNRNGMTTAHNLWPGSEFKGTQKPDTQTVQCMKDCLPPQKVSSSIPDYARNSHGNLASQNRLIGAQHGADTSKSESDHLLHTAAVASEPIQKNSKPIGLTLIDKNGCTGCHGVTEKIVGPPFQDVAKKYPEKAEYLAQKIRNGGSGIWGAIPMPAQSASEADVLAIASWLASGAKR